jgi:uncharacterized damage-inducible protein DinB
MPRRTAKTKPHLRAPAKRDNPRPGVAALCLRQWRLRLEERYLPRITDCLDQLSDEEIWWRPNPASNSVGNLLLHLCGNMRQWIISGLGGTGDIRERDAEFSERGPIRGSVLREQLEKTVEESCRVLGRLDAKDLTRRYRIQHFDVSGYEAAAQVIEHVAYHAGQIIYVTKLKREKDLRFTQLPSADAKAAERKLRL